jgi:hypothetical protein
MATRMQQRRGTASQWTSSNDGDGPILNAGEIGWESDTNKFKIGDGVSYWADLTYFVDATDVIASSLGSYLQDSDVGAVSGVAGLDSSKNLLVPGSSIIVEGTTDDGFETTLTVTNPTADRTITFPDDTGTVQLRVADVSDTEIGYLNGVTSGIQTQIDAKAPTSAPTFTGTVTASNNLVVDGDFTVNGTNFAASATTITIEDNMVQLAHQNAANTVDLGIVVGYNDGSAKHAGLVRDVSDAKWKLFKGVTTEPTTTVNFGQGSLDDLELGVLTASSITLGDGSVLGTPTSVTLTNATGLPVSTGISGLGTGVATFLATPSSANFASMLTDEIGTGNVLLSDMATNPQTASYTLVLADKAKVVEMNVGSANSLTVPTNASVEFPIGTQIHIVQTGSGQTTVVAPSGGTVNTATTLKLRAQWSAATLIKRAENTWVLVGDLATS